jgi:hypothetical protein
MIRFVMAGAATAAAGLTAFSVLAADSLVRGDEAIANPLRDRLFFFAGTDVARDSFFGWAGIVAAPLALLDEDGPRIRMVGGVGRYRYLVSTTLRGANTAQVTSAEILLGFRRGTAAANFTAYLGPHVEGQRLDAPDPGNPSAGTAFGVKGAVEFFAHIAPRWSASGSASASTVHRAYHVRVALARADLPGAGLGFETIIHGDARYLEPRAGLFAHATIGRSVLALSGGLLYNSDKGSGAYTTLSLYAPY